MASPAVVNSVNTTFAVPATSFNAALPASIIAGNLLFMWVGVNVRDAGTVGFPAGWTIDLDDTQLSATHRVVLAKKTATGAEGATATITNGATASRACTIAMQISGHEDPATQAPQYATMAVGSSTSMDAGTVTPTGGSKDYLFVIFGSTTASASSGTPPTNYGGRQSVGNSLDHNQHMCFRQATVASENPAGWALSPTGPWVVTVAAVHPGTAAAHQPYYPWPRRAPILAQ